MEKYEQWHRPFGFQRSLSCFRDSTECRSCRRYAVKSRCVVGHQHKYKEQNMGICGLVESPQVKCFSLAPWSKKASYGYSNSLNRPQTYYGIIDTNVNCYKTTLPQTHWNHLSANISVFPAQTQTFHGRLSSPTICLVFSSTSVI